jgi:hypothetical protein
MPEREQTPEIEARRAELQQLKQQKQARVEELRKRPTLSLNAAENEELASLLREITEIGAEQTRLIFGDPVKP